MGVAYLQKWLIGDMIISCVLYDEILIMTLMRPRLGLE